jgi:hypothetical protein
VTSSSPDLGHFSLLKSKETQKTLIRSRLWFFMIYLMIFRKFSKKCTQSIDPQFSRHFF